MEKATASVPKMKKKALQSLKQSDSDDIENEEDDSKSGGNDNENDNENEEDGSENEEDGSRTRKMTVRAGKVMRGAIHPKNPKMKNRSRSQVKQVKSKVHQS